ncbi:MAG: glycosyltransferase family 2 protein [Thermodesulfobacteriaceae bacterium]|nr:glycosyltransferase family 2 protein [Thermodesulfobacteriaceae bacterium]MCX8040878.1 glycosyltransferase family 2 protein [Thermodesulfobacteriaceae bacterium]MDW8135215.1 glycosyltransferase family 2 protein [Thermodesulfobacterium sp.]
MIITTYNNPIFLKKVLQGVLNQTLLPYEVIVADDGSTEETFKVIREYQEVFPIPLLHVWHEDLGFRAAKIRNEAIKLASGEYMVFLDGDCIPDKNFILDHLILSEKGYFVQGKRILLDSKISQKFDFESIKSFYKKLILFFSPHISNRHHLIRLSIFPSFKNQKIKGIKGCNLGIFKKDLIAVNGFNEDFMGWGREDTELIIRLYKYGLKRKEHPFKAICFHLWHPPQSKENLYKNELLLKKTLQSREYFCSNGIIKKPFF